VRIDSFKPPKNYDPEMNKAASDFSQGRCEDADSILNAVPSTQPGYTDLKRKIAECRQEDQTFAQKKAEFSQAETSKNKDALRSVRPFFISEANRAGRHRDDARNTVEKIDANLKELETPKSGGGGSGSGSGGGVAPTSNYKEEILAVLNQYAAAYTRGDLEQVKSVRDLTAKQEKTLRESFKLQHGIPTVISNCTIVQTTAVAAKANCTVQTGSEEKPRPVTYSLARINGGWRIVASN
jgi:hypothetical protein